jgi:hypothetical protein
VYIGFSGTYIYIKFMIGISSANKGTRYIGCFSHFRSEYSLGDIVYKSNYSECLVGIFSASILSGWNILCSVADP